MIPYKSDLLKNQIAPNILNNPRFYELRFTPVYQYEVEFGWTMTDKITMLEKVITYLEARNIFITFTDRILDDAKKWERQANQDWRYLPIAELQGNNICINARNIDFVSIFMSIGHIYGHLVQRMNEEKYRPITDFLDYPKPLKLDDIFAEYRSKFNGDYKDDFKKFEIEAFQYAKFTFIDAGIEFTSLLDYAMNVYIETDFNELWKWVSISPQKSGPTFMAEFQKIWNNNKNRFPALEPIPIHIKVTTKEEETLVVVRDGY